MSSIKICNHCNIPFKYDWHVEYNTCPTCGNDKSDNVIDTEINLKSFIEGNEELFTLTNYNDAESILKDFIHFYEHQKSLKNK